MRTLFQGCQWVGGEDPIQRAARLIALPFSALLLLAFILTSDLRLVGLAGIFYRVALAAPPDARTAETPARTNSGS
jgi:hypothetical protein